MKKLLLVAVLLLFSIGSYSQTLEDDRLALVAFYNATEGKTWRHSFVELGPWVIPGNPGDSPCGWVGVGCENNRVVNLNVEEIGGHIPPEIGNLDALKSLTLSGNPFSENPLSGQIPAEIAKLTKLEQIHLPIGVYDVDNFKILGSFTGLKDIFIYISGPIPKEITNLRELEYLNLSRGNRTVEALTTIPEEIGNLTSLKALAISGNGMLKGPIPSQIGNLTNLKFLDISGLTEGGTIPKTIGALRDLNTLYLTQNGHIGSIPAELASLTSATRISLESNNLQSPIPDLLSLGFRISVQGNKLNFDIEKFDQQFDRRNSQQPLELHNTNGLLSVNAGGTLANNTYKWYRNRILVKTIKGDSTYLPEQNGEYYVEITNSVFTHLTLSTSNIQDPLPVTLTSFIGARSSNGNQLSWKTTSETNNKGFEIERSTDARVFEKIGFLEGAGDAQQTKFYRFTDLNPSGITYYRLKQMDFDGTFEHSRIIMVKSDLDVNVYPNPARDHIIVSGLDRDKDLVIIDRSGETVLKQKIENDKVVTIEKLKSGIYTLKIGERTKRIAVSK